MEVTYKTKKIEYKKEESTIQKQERIKWIRNKKKVELKEK